MFKNVWVGDYLIIYLFRNFTRVVHWNLDSENILNVYKSKRTFDNLIRDDVWVFDNIVLWLIVFRSCFWTYWSGISLKLYI